MWPAFFFQLSILIILSAPVCRAQAFDRTLIAHRGGVVDSTHTENGLPALQDAARRGYWMVELDMRLTKDSVLIAQHDNTLNRFYGQDRPVGQTNWNDMAGLVSQLDGNTPQPLERMLQECQRRALQVMIDNKINGLDTLLFARIVGLLRKYELQEKALMIGTDESTPYFTGKIRLSCTRQQLEENQKKPGYRADHYFLFEGPKTLTQESVQWANRHGIMVVAAINKWAYKQSPDYLEVAKKDIERLKSYGIQYFQIDSEFDRFFRR